MFACCFLGHKDCPQKIKDNLSDAIKDLIVNKNVTTFYVGTHGNFDYLAYKVLCELEKIYTIKIIVVLAYLNTPNTNNIYDCKKTIFPDELSKVPLRFAISKRNSYMINRSDYIITYLENKFTNTFPNIEKAKKKKKQIINLGNFDIETI